MSIEGLKMYGINVLTHWFLSQSVSNKTQIIWFYVEVRFESKTNKTKIIEIEENNTSYACIGLFDLGNIWDTKRLLIIYILKYIRDNISMFWNW